jgi:CubicO group peptidase (beta-lactamase class C family)
VGPGARHGYHGTSFGWLVGEPVRRVTGTTVREFLWREVLARLQLDGFMGTPPDQHPRMATLVWGTRAHGRPVQPPSGPTSKEATLAQRTYAPVLPPLAPPMNDAAFRSAAIPVTGAAVTARTFAVIICGELARGGGALVSPNTARAMGEAQVDGEDAILGIPVSRDPGLRTHATLGRRWAPSARVGSSASALIATSRHPAAWRARRTRSSWAVTYRSRSLASISAWPAMITMGIGSSFRSDAA